jgi:small subunit ribosomal protein S16
VAVKIKLKRLGKIREPYYRIVVADARTKRDGRAIEEIGKYHPKAEPSFIEVNSERVQHWLSVGAQPTDPVRVLLKITGDWQKFTGEPGSEGTLRTAEPRADKQERFTAAAKESQATKEAKEAKGAGQGRTQSRTAKPAKDTAPKDTAPKDTAPKDAPAKDAPAKDRAPKEAKDSAPKDAPAKDAPAKGRAKAEGDGGDAKASAGPVKEAPEAPESAVAADASSEGAADAKAAADEPGSGA